MAVGINEARHQDGIAKIKEAIGGTGFQVRPTADGRNLIIRD
jgi:hypothetical protein